MLTIDKSAPIAKLGPKVQIGIGDAQASCQARDRCEVDDLNAQKPRFVLDWREDEEIGSDKQPESLFGAGDRDPTDPVDIEGHQAGEQEAY